MEFISLYGEAVKTSLGFFWKAGWAFILGYFISSMIQAFVPKTQLTKYMGKGDLKSVSLSTLFGSASSSCSFAALATARSLLLKGAHFIAVVAFMFASTNLVIELGILIVIFLGWQFLVAEIIGGLLLIAISSILIKTFYPANLIEAARQKVRRDSSVEEDSFDWRKRISSKNGWRMVGNKFVMEWQMVWQEILIGFTLAGFIATLVPETIWAKIFLMDVADTLPAWVVALENALVAPFVAAMTFIGSMGNIPLATVLNANGVFFAGIMGFIYSDLMVPPLVAVNAKYYGKKVAFYIAGIMYVSIVITALTLNWLFGVLDILPHSNKVISSLTSFSIDYTFWMNIAFALLAAVMIFLHKSHQKKQKMAMGGGMKHHQHGQEKKSISAKQMLTYTFIAILFGGIISQIIATLTL